MTTRRNVPVRLRLPLLAAGGLALLGGLYAALVRLELPVPDPTGRTGDTHGAVMVLGFVGTLVALERAVALAARWGLLAPLCSALGALVLLAGGPALIGYVLLAAGGVGLLAVYAVIWRRQASAALLTQAAGAFCWYAATLLWLGGFPISQTIAWLAGFAVLTIAGERLELAHVGLLGRASDDTASGARAAERWLLAAVAALLAGAAASVLWPGSGYHLYGLALLGLVAWLAVFDVARRTVRGRGLPRFVAVGLLAGYGWLALAGALWAGGGTTTDGPRYDATLHAVFLGFTISMIVVHAPVILPAVLRRPLPYHPVLYAPLALLHLSLLARVGLGDPTGWTALWRWSGVANEVAVVAFFGCAAVLVARGRHAGRAVRGPRVTAVGP